MRPAALDISRDTLPEHRTVVLTEMTGFPPGGDGGFVIIDRIDVTSGIDGDTAENEGTIPFAPIAHVPGWEFSHSFEGIMYTRDIVGEV